MKAIIERRWTELSKFTQQEVFLDPHSTCRCGGAISLGRSWPYSGKFVVFAIGKKQMMLILERFSRLTRHGADGRVSIRPMGSGAPKVISSPKSCIVKRPSAAHANARTDATLTVLADGGCKHPLASLRLAKARLRLASEWSGPPPKYTRCARDLGGRRSSAVR